MIYVYCILLVVFLVDGVILNDIQNEQYSRVKFI